MTAIKILKSRFHNALRAVSLFMSRDETRFHLCSVRFESGEDCPLQLVATDGHTLATVRPIASGGESGAVAISAESVRTLIEVSKLDRGEADIEIEVAILPDELRVGGFIFPRIGGEFPSYGRCVPRAGEVDKRSKRTEICGVNPFYLARVVDACKLFAGGKTPAQRGERYEYTSFGAKGRKPRVEYRQTAIRITSPEYDGAPMRFDWSHCDAGDLTAIVMPMRL